MTILYLLLPSICAAAFIAIMLLPYRQWSDTDYYALVHKYSDAASALTAMKSELDKLQEKLEFSEDVRYSLGMENAKLAEEIGKLKQDAERGEEARFFLLDQLNIVIKDKWRLEDRLKTAQRSLRIARHKEFKRWKKKMRKNPYIVNFPPLRAIGNSIRAEHLNQLSELRKSAFERHEDIGDLFRMWLHVSRKSGPYPLP